MQGSSWRDNAPEALQRARCAASRVAVVALSAILVFGQTPAQLWADGAEGLVQAFSEASGIQDQGSGEGSSSITSPDTVEFETETTGTGDGSGDSAQNDAGAAAEAGDTSSEGNEATPSGDTTQPQNAETKSASRSTQAPPQSKSGVADIAGSGGADGGEENRALAEDAFLLIQDTKDKDSTYSYVSGAVSAGAVLWANMYEPSGYYGADVVPAEDGWSYQWLQSDKKSGNASDFTPISGETGQSLTVTDSLAGKYIAVQVTVDGSVHYGPRTSSTYTDINMNYLPGPVIQAGMVELYQVRLSNTSPSVGDTLTATAYTDYSTPVGEGVNVTYTWQQGDSRYGTFTTIEGAGNGNAFTLTEAQQGKYIKVIASAGVNEKEATTSDAVMAEGAVKLAGVGLEAPDSLQMPLTLTAKAYTGSSYSPTYVDDSKVTYTWKYAKTASPSYSTEWTTIEGETGSTLVIDDEQYAGCYFTVFANAGANDVEVSYYNAVGPVKLEGQVDIYSAFLAASSDASSGGYVYTSDQTVYAKAKEKGASTTIASENLTYQWQVSWTSRAGDDNFENIDGATSESLSLSGYEGAYVRCVVTAKVGGSTYPTTATMKIAAPGSLNITSVRVSPTGKVNVGDTLTATATASTGDVTNDSHVTWSWYYGDSSSSIDTKIENATGSTLVVTDALLGKYIEARADGGFGEEASTGTVGPVIEPGSVELYQVTVSGDARVGSKLTATAYKGNSYTEVSASDKVHYQWQYANTNTTSDSAFTDIPGATASTYVIGEDMHGKYLRVKATSDGSVVSTKKPSYYGTTYVDPIGPIMLEGQYTLSGVELESSGQAAQAGNTITPTAMVEGEYYGDDPAPSDAKLTFTWEERGEDGVWTPLIEGVEDMPQGKLLLLDSYVGKMLRVSASALDNEVTSDSFTVLPEGVYDLLRVTTSPSINSTATQLFTGDTLTATVQARGMDTSSSYGDDVTEDVEVQWYASDAPDGEFAAIEGADSAELTLTADLAGKYLKAVATSGSSQVEIASVNPVIDANSLAGIVAKLEDENWRLSLTYGEDTNANDVLLAKLAAMGVEDVTVRTTAVEVTNPNEKATLGISTGDADNGAITYFFMDPDDLTGWSGFTTYQTFTPTFELSRDGETVTFTPERTTTMPWDEARVVEMLKVEAAEALAIAYAEGDTAASVTQNVTLPLELTDKDWSKVSWSSSNEDVIQITGYAWDETNTGKVARPSADTKVTLTASVSIMKSGAPELSVEVPFEVTVKADPEAIEAARAELQKKVDTAFTAVALTYAEDGSKVDASAVAGDLQLPRTSAIDIDGKYYTVEYTASNDAIEVNGYRANVYQPLPGGAGASVELTLTVTSKENAEIKAAKTIELTVAPLEADAIEAELTLMEQAKAGYATALLNGQSADAVTRNLSIFQKAYLDESGELAWARSYDEANAAGDGIVTDDLEPGDEMGTVPGHWFKSSNASVIAHDTLLVTKPDYDTQVTVTSKLSSEKYARYIERYAGDATWGETFAQLAGQEVSATFTVAGAKGAENPNVEATISVVGTDAFGDDQVWTASTSYVLEKGSTAADLTEAMLAAMGLKADYGEGAYGWYLNTITAPDGRVLGYDAATGKYWQLFVNGRAFDLGAGSVTLNPGDEVVWYYSAYGTSLDDIGQAKITATVQIIGPDAEGADTSWMNLTEISLPQGSTAADLTERALELAGLEADTGTGSYGWFLNSITSPFTGEVLGTVETEPGVWPYWQLFVNGEVSEFGAGSVELEPGDQVVWFYSSYGESLPENDVEVNPDAWDGRPSDWEAAWDGIDSGTLDGIATPTEGGELAWSIDLGSNIDASVYANDPLIVNGNVYIAVGDELRVYDATTHKQLASAKLATAIDSVSRMVYTDGVVVVPLNGGRLQVLTADTLTTVSLTEALGQGQQSLSSITVNGGYAYFGTTDGSGTRGAYFCVNLRTGAVVWSTEDAGNYWTGGVMAGQNLVTIDNAGVVRVRDAQTGEAVGELSLGGTVRAQLVADPEDASTLYAVTNDGVLHRIELGADGTLVHAGSVKFAASSTSTPTIVDGRAYVGGASADFKGVLAVIDLATMKVEQSVTGFANGAALPGDVKSTPTVSVQGGETYVYFTCNAPGGAAYLYRVGDAYARVLYQPKDTQAGYTMASVVAGADGSLYYINDSGHLFKLTPGSAIDDPEPEKPVEGDTTPDRDAASGGATLTLEQLVSRVATSIRLTGNVQSSEGDASSSSLLEGYTSADVIRSLLGVSAEDKMGAEGSSASARLMPLWPFAGMAVGAVVLIALALRTRKNGEGW